MITWNKAYSRSEHEPWEPYSSKCVNTCFCWSCTSSTEFNTDFILKAHFVQDYYCCYLAFAEVSPAEAHLGVHAWPLWSQRHQTSPTSKESLLYSVRWLCCSPAENNACKKEELNPKLSTSCREGPWFWSGHQTLLYQMTFTCCWEPGKELCLAHIAKEKRLCSGAGFLTSVLPFCILAHKEMNEEIWIENNFLILCLFLT